MILHVIFFSCFIHQDSEGKLNFDVASVTHPETDKKVSTFVE